MEVLKAPHTLEFPYTRSVGPVIGEFFEGLKDRKILGARTKDGRVMVPPAEYDTEGRDVDGLVEVGQSGVVTTWSWQPSPREGQPLDRPFAWALIRLDGADTAMLHAVDGRVETGDRVRVRWRAQTVGDITDIECFEPQ